MTTKAEKLCDSKLEAFNKISASIRKLQIELSVLEKKIEELESMEQEYQNAESSADEIEKRLEEVKKFLEKYRPKYQAYEDLRQTVELEQGSLPPLIKKYQLYLKESYSLSERLDKVSLEIGELEIYITDERLYNGQRRLRMGELKSQIQSQQSKLLESESEYYVYLQQLELLQKQIKLESQIPELVLYIASNWDVHSANPDAIQSLLTPFNCCIPTRKIQEIIDWFEKNMDILDIIYDLVEKESDEEEDAEMEVLDFEAKSKSLLQEVSQMFGPELLVAVAHTVRLIIDFPPNFCTGKYGIIGTKLHNGQTYIIGNKPAEIAGLIDSKPEWFTNMIEDDVDKNLFMCFKKEHKTKQEPCSSQLYNMKTFRKHFWRVDNFYGFDLTSELQVLEHRESMANCQKALEQHITLQQEAGVYLEADFF